MAEFIVTPQDYLKGGRLYNQPDIVVVEPPGVEPITDKATGVSYTPGSRAITVTKADYGNLPKEIRAAIGGSETDTINYNPYKGMTGYAFDEKTGQVIVQNSPGNFAFLGARYQSTPSGGLVPKAPDDEGDALVTSDSGDVTTSNFSSGATVVSTYTDPTTGDVIAVMSDATTKVLAPGGAKDAAAKSAYDLLYSEFDALGIGGLVPALRDLITEGVSPAEFTLRLRQTDAYKKRFAANAQRVAKGLRALSEAEYVAKEDFYQDVMRRYGLPESYYARGEMGRQEGFEKLIANDVSDTELEDRISTAQRRVLNANPEVTQALKQFYPDISNGEILAYTLDPKNAIEEIKRKVTAAEIGGAAVRSGLTTNVADAEYLRNYGVTKETAEQGYGTIAGGLQRGSQLASIYGESPYTQATAEQEVFNVPGAQEARKQRQKITGLEKATFGGQSGLTSSALTRDRAGGY
jgi:hypothetical protein